MRKLIIVAGDAGVYVGNAEGGTKALRADGRIELFGARHLRRYYVAGKVGDGSAGDLAVKGLDPVSPSISVSVPGSTVLLGCRRAFEVALNVTSSFGVLS